MQADQVTAAGSVLLFIAHDAARRCVTASAPTSLSVALGDGWVWGALEMRRITETVWAWRWLVTQIQLGMFT